MNRLCATLSSSILGLGTSVVAAQTLPASLTLRFVDESDATAFSSPGAWRGRDESPRMLDSPEQSTLIFRLSANGDRVVTNDLGSPDAPLKVHSITLGPPAKPLSETPVSVRIEGNPIQLEPLPGGEPPRITTGARDPKKDVSSFDIACDLHFNSTLTLTGDGNQRFRISGNLQADGADAGLTKQGSAAIELAGTGAWTGASILKKGAVQLKDGFSFGTGPLTIEAGATLALQSEAQRAGLSKSLQIAEKGQLNLNSGIWIVDYDDESPMFLIQSMIRDGRIVTANPRPNQLIACVEASSLDLERIGDRDLDENMIIVAVARPGDTNLDFKVDVEDLKRVKAAYNKPGNWSDGDTNADGRVDFDDLLKIAQDYDTGLSFQKDWDALQQ